MREELEEVERYAKRTGAIGLGSTEGLQRLLNRVHRELKVKRLQQSIALVPAHVVELLDDGVTDLAGDWDEAHPHHVAADLLGDLVRAFLRELNCNPLKLDTGRTDANFTSHWWSY